MIPIVNLRVNGSASVTAPLQSYVTKVLRPNIVDTRNILPEYALSSNNTKYIIRWDYDLDGKTLQVGSNCLIEFDGGSMSNGTIEGNHTTLIYFQQLGDVIKEGATLTGTWRYESGVKADGDTLTEVYGVIKVRDGGIGTDQLKEESVTYEKIAAESIDSTKLAPEVVDNEDLHFNTTGSLQLTDKTYNPADFSGLGRVYLRKNMVTPNAATAAILAFDDFTSQEVTVEQQPYVLDIAGVHFHTGLHVFLAKVTPAGIGTPKWYQNWQEQGSYAAGNEYNQAEEGAVFAAGEAYYALSGTIGTDATLVATSVKNVLTQQMISQSNTIYHIQYDYDLNGQTITVPEGCVLAFEGGSLRNGALVGQTTKITGIASISATMSGTWSNIYADVEALNSAMRAAGSTLPASGDYIGYCFFDTTLHKAVWWNGNGWVDANGNVVDDTAQA